MAQVIIKGLTESQAKTLLNQLDAEEINFLLDNANDNDFLNVDNTDTTIDESGEHIYIIETSLQEEDENEDLEHFYQNYILVNGKVPIITDSTKYFFDMVKKAQQEKKILRRR